MQRYIVTLFTKIKAKWKSILNHVTQNDTVQISGKHMLIYGKIELLFVVNKRRRPVLSFRSIQPALEWHSLLGEQRGGFFFSRWLEPATFSTVVKRSNHSAMVPLFI